MRTTSQVTEDDCRHADDTVDPTAPGYGEHLPFHVILQRCGVAWRHHLESLDVVSTAVIVPNLDADFLAEVHVGELDIDVSLVRVGTSSFTARCAVSQEGRPAARVDVVLVNFDYASRRPVPLSDAQAARLRAEVVA